MRKLAKEKNMTLETLQKIAENNKKLDKQLDQKQKNLENQDNYVMDSRLGYHFIPNSYKILLITDAKTAAKRIHKRDHLTESYKDLEHAEKSIKKRMKSEKKRYKKHYKINYPDKKDFDLIINTTKKTAKQVVNIIIKKINPLINQ